MEQSQSANNKCKGKSVTVLLPSDVTVGRTGEVFMPNTMEMAKIRKPWKGQFSTGIEFTSTMTKEDVERELCNSFSILRDQR